MRLALVVLAAALPALAQEQDVQRALIQRDQQSAEFELRLRQSQESPQPAPGDNRHLRQKAADERTLVLPPPAVQTKPPEKPRPLPHSQ